MSAILPKALLSLIEELSRLPGVGSRSAERYAYFLLRSKSENAASLARAIENLHAGVKLCPKTFALIDAEQDVSPLYTGTNRNKKLVAVVEEPFDVLALERSNNFKGTYHVLGGALSPIDGITPEQLHIPELIARLVEDEVEEVILATNSSVEGESTALFIQRHIQDAGLNLKLTRLARGIPAGLDLEYADQLTLSHALEGRRLL
jgi:recombination protein RecR